MSEGSFLKSIHTRMPTTNIRPAITKQAVCQCEASLDNEPSAPKMIFVTMISLTKPPRPLAARTMPVTVPCPDANQRLTITLASVVEAQAKPAPRRIPPR